MSDDNGTINDNNNAILKPKTADFDNFIILSHFGFEMIFLSNLCFRTIFLSNLIFEIIKMVSYLSKLSIKNENMTSFLSSNLIQKITKMIIFNHVLNDRIP